MMSDREKGIVLLLFKDFTASYNARTLSRHVGMTPRGALKALKNLEKRDFVVGRRFGRAIEYRINLKNSLARKVVELLLLEEAELKHKRWLEEFRKFDEAHILLLFGSVLRTRHYNDIDLLVVVDKAGYRGLMGKIEAKNRILPKRIHPVVQTPQDLKSNLAAKDAVVLDALKTGVVIKGGQDIVEVVSSVAGS